MQRNKGPRDMTERRTHYIYTLCDDEIERTLYVGRTIDPEGRLYEHFVSAELCLNNMREALHLPICQYKETWMAFLILQDRLPRLEILETLVDATWPQAADKEREWIQVLLDRGYPLVNATHNDLDKRHSCPYSEMLRCQYGSEVEHRIHSNGEPYISETIPLEAILGVNNAEEIANIKAHKVAALKVKLNHRSISLPKDVIRAARVIHRRFSAEQIVALIDALRGMQPDPADGEL